MDEHFIYIVLEIVSEIPKGSVATYKQIAELAGRERNARQVGKILSASSLYGEYPCHRVVNSAGRTAPDWNEQVRCSSTRTVNDAMAGVLAI